MPSFSYVMPLRGAVLSRYRNMSGFSRAIGWTANKSTRILNGKTAPSLSDCNAIAKTLQLSGEEVLNIFFPGVLTNVIK